jgi:hypothetical protein
MLRAEHVVDCADGSGQIGMTPLIGIHERHS